MTVRAGFQWGLDTVEIENFKSIRACCTKIQRGMTVITGPNGSGKSNFMDAIAFCLGVDLKDLRVSSLQDLCGNQSERVLCQLTFVKGNETVKLAGLITDKQRVYKVNGLKVTKEKLKFTLQHTLGFAKDSVCWLTGQSSVHKIVAASPKSLYDSLTFVSGTHTLLATRDRVQSDMQLLKNQYSVLSGLIQEFESSFHDHKKLIASIERSGVLKAQLEDLEGKLKSHETHFEHLKHFELYLKLQQLKLDIDACSSEIEKIEEGFNEIEDVDDDTHITETERRLCELDNDIAQKTIKIADLQSMQSTLEHQFKEAETICIESNSELKGFRDSLLAQEVLSKRFRQRLEYLDNEIRIARMELHCETPEDVTKSMALELDQVTDQLHQIQTTIMTSTGFHAQLVSRFDNISSRQNALRMRIISIRDGLEFTAITDCEKSIANEAEDIIKAKRALENATYPLIDNKARLVNLAKILRINIPEPLGLVEREIDGDLGTVAELLTISNALPKMLQVPIFSLLAPYLGIRVCESNDAARRLLQYIDKSHLSCRIWVISRLQSANQRSVPNSLLQKFGSVIIDPKAYVTGAEKVIGKIFTNWVILKDAQYLQTLLHEHVNCVTLDGYKHTLGSLTLYSKREAEDASLDTLTAFSATMIEYRRCLAHSRECEERVRTKDARLKYFHMNLIKLREVVTADADYNEFENELKLLDQQIKAVAEDIETARVLYSVKEAHMIGLKRRIDSIKSRNLTGLQLRLETVNNSTTHLNNLLAEQTILFGKLSDATTTCHQLKLSIEEAEYLYKEHFEESKLLQAQLEETASSIKSEEVYLGNCTYEQTQCRLQIEALEVKKSALVERVSSDKIRLCGLITKRDSLLRSSEEYESILSAADYRYANENVGKMSADNLMVKIASVEKVIVDFQVQKKFVHSELMQTKATIKPFAQNDTDDLKSLQMAVDTRYKSQQIKLEELQHRSSLAGNGILVLEKGLEDVRKLLDSIHRSTFELLRSRVKVYFKDLVPGKMADLGLAGDKLEDGLKFVLYNHEEDDRKEVQSLSGGEKSLLGLTFIFASALHKRSPLYLLDEVDAALDEGNIGRIALIIQKIFGQSQAICISHHVQFHGKDLNSISVTIAEGISKVN